MSEIGAGSGSSYPGSLDTNAAIEINSPNPGKTKAKAEVINDLAAAIIAVETELGVDPAGSKATVVARLDTEHNADGSHKDTLVVTVSGHNQSISGRKIFASGISLGVDGLFGTATGHTTGKTVVGASGAMWIQDDVRTSGSFHSTRNPTHGLELANKQYVDEKLSRNSRVSVTSGAVTLTTSDTSIKSVNLVPLIVNDIILISVNLTIAKGGTGGRNLIYILPGGTSTIVFSGGNVAMQHEFYQEASTTYSHQVTLIGTVTVAGTATINLSGSSFGSNSTISANQGDMDITILRT